MTSERKQYFHNKQLIYQWQQSLDSIIIFVQAPLVPKQIKLSTILQIKITSIKLIIGIKGNPPYLEHEFIELVDTDESLWYIQNKQNLKQEIIIQIQKAQKGIRWGNIFKGHKNLNILQEQELKKKMMLERFQQQNPGFDFTNAQFNGNIPEARTFMGGVKYQ